MEIREKYGRRLGLLSQLTLLVHGATFDFETHEERLPWEIAGFDFYRAKSLQRVVVQFACDRLPIIGVSLNMTDADTVPVALPIVECSAHTLMALETNLRQGRAGALMLCSLHTRFVLSVKIKRPKQRRLTI